MLKQFVYLCLISLISGIIQQKVKKIVPLGLHDLLPPSLQIDLMNINSYGEMKGLITPKFDSIDGEIKYMERGQQIDKDSEISHSEKGKFIHKDDVVSKSDAPRGKDFSRQIMQTLIKKKGEDMYVMVTPDFKNNEDLPILQFNFERYYKKSNDSYLVVESISNEIYFKMEQKLDCNLKNSSFPVWKKTYPKTYKVEYDIKIYHFDYDCQIHKVRNDSDEEISNNYPHVKAKAIAGQDRSHDDDGNQIKNKSDDDA